MKAFQGLSKALVILGLSQAGTAFGDSFYDFGLQWTQWIGNQGQARRTQSDNTSGSTIKIPVPSPSTAERAAFQVYLQASKAAAEASAARSSNQSSYTQPTPTPVVTLPAPVATAVDNTGSTTTYDFGVSSSPASVSVPASSFSPPGSSASSRYDALINMGSGPYSMSDQLLTGTPQAWYQSPVVQGIYGGLPSADQQKSFEQDVLQKVQQTYAQSGINVNLTLDPNANAARTISVVSGASFGSIKDAAGITSDNSNGFSFIDKLNGAKNLDDLEWAVAHNVAHELMHSFGVDHHDSSGEFLDGAIANWNMLLDPNTKFSSVAVSDLQNNLSAGLSDNHNSAVFGFLGQSIHQADAMILAPPPVPEPATVAIWVVGGCFAYMVRKKRSNA